MSLSLQVGRADVQLASAPYLVKYVNPVGCAVQSCAIWITVLLAVNRYVAVCRPFIAPRWLTMPRTRLQVRRTPSHVTVLTGCAPCRPRCRCGSLQRSPDPLTGFKGAYF